MSQTSYETHFFVCTNQREAGHAKGCCASKGSQEVLEALKEACKKKNLHNYRVNKAGCLGFCEKGVAVVNYPQGTWYFGVRVGDVEKLVR